MKSIGASVDKENYSLFVYRINGLNICGKIIKLIRENCEKENSSLDVGYNEEKKYTYTQPSSISTIENS